MSLLCPVLVASTRASTTTPSFFFFLMIRRPPRSTLDRSSAASDVYKRQAPEGPVGTTRAAMVGAQRDLLDCGTDRRDGDGAWAVDRRAAVSYTHLRAHETVLDLVCRLLLEKKQVLVST